MPSRVLLPLRLRPAPQSPAQSRTHRERSFPLTARTLDDLASPARSLSRVMVPQDDTWSSDLRRASLPRDMATRRFIVHLAGQKPKARQAAGGITAADGFNPRPPACKAGALATDLDPQVRDNRKSRIDNLLSTVHSRFSPLAAACAARPQRGRGKSGAQLPAARDEEDSPASSTYHESSFLYNTAPNIYAVEDQHGQQVSPELA